MVDSVIKSVKEREFNHLVAALLSRLKIPLQGGKCGVRGDAFGDVEPRQHEDGGKYGKGIITAQYQPGFEPYLMQVF